MPPRDRARSRARATRLAAVLAATVLAVGWLAPAATASGDDYPYRNQTNPSAGDPWGFTQRQCVSFAAWRLHQAGRTINNRSGWGSAGHWASTARALGYTVSTRPAASTVAHWYANESSTGPTGTMTAGPYGHVGWVARVYADGTVLIEQYNLAGDRSYGTWRGRAPRYLYIKTAAAPRARAPQPPPPPRRVAPTPRRTAPKVTPPNAPVARRPQPRTASRSRAVAVAPRRAVDPGLRTVESRGSGEWLDIPMADSRPDAPAHLPLAPVAVMVVAAASALVLRRP